MESGLLSLKWNNHSSTFFHVLETIRRKELYSDVTIACDGKFFSVHKLVLSTCSEYFQEMFEKTQCKHPIIVLKDINYKDLESLLNYMYIGEVNVIQTELASLIKAAECLKVKGLAVPDEPPPSHKRSSKRPLGSDKEDSFSSSKRNRRSGSTALQSSSQNSVAKDDRGNSDTISSDIGVEMATADKEKELRHEEQSSNHNYKEYESVNIKTEKEDSNSESYVDNELPPVSKFEYDASSVDTSINPSLDEGTDSSSYSSHLQPQSHSTEDQMGHLLPTTSRFHGESSWGSDRLEESDKERGEGGSYDPNSYLLDNPQATKSQVASFFLPGHLTNNNTTDLAPDLTHHAFMTREGTMWKCTYPDCSYQAYNKGNLAKHVRKHTGERPYACYMCDYRSKESSNLYKHVKYRHSQ